MQELEMLGDIVLVSELRRVGLDDRAVRHAAARGDWVRLHRGAYMSRSQWNGMSPDARFRARARAVSLAHPGRVILSHLAAGSLWGMPLLDRPPSQIDVLDRRSGGSKSADGLRRHAADMDAVESVVHGGIVVTGFERTLVDIARTCDLATAVTCLDWALSPRSTGPVVTTESLVDVAAAIPFSHGRRRMQTAFDFADGRSGSPGESASRVLMHLLGFPAPELQVEFQDGAGSIGIVDFWWESARLIGEFDGMRKYLGDRFGSRLSAEEVVVAEKRREDRLRARGAGMVRWDWSATRSPAVLRTQLLDAGLTPAARDKPSIGVALVPRQGRSAG